MEKLKVGDEVYYRKPLGFGKFITNTGIVEVINEKAGTARVELNNKPYQAREVVAIYNLRKVD